jgi:hypothetical protein
MPDLLNGLPLRSVALGTKDQIAKAEALGQYRSELEHASGQPILPEELLWPARQCEVFLPV